MQSIQTDIITLENPQGVDPFTVYRRVVAKYGDHHAFLAESLDGPLTDREQSIVSICLVASICFTTDTIRITGNDAVTDYLINQIKAAVKEIRFSDEGVARIGSHQQFWATLRVLLESSYRTGTDCDDHVGYVVRIGYDAASLIEKIPRSLPRATESLIRLDLYQHIAIFKDGRILLHVNSASGFDEPDVTDLKMLFEPLDPLPEFSTKDLQVRFSTTQEQYLLACQQALEHIHAGDIYQVQLGHSIQVRNEMPPVALYSALRRLNPAPYMFLHQASDIDLVGASPENYVRVREGVLSMRPIAGTQGKLAHMDSATLRQELSTSPKENAEHTMLVDLCRNDIGRLCEPGTLAVPNLMELEEFPSLYHLISTVQGDLRTNVDLVEVLLSTFPAGTMVGAPKIRAMEIIENLEASPRGQYAGAIGFIGFRGSMNMALCIRMASRQNGEYQIRASAGIVYDSQPEREWQETLTKMRLMYRALTGKELLK